MPKNIVVCSDGTGNAGFKNRGTNVYKLFEAIDVHEKNGIRQFKVYDDGVGTRRLKPLKAVGLAFGLGLRRNVFELYEAIARAYEPGDQIYMFGFSRGAFTVRLLAGFICDRGITDINAPGVGSLRDRTKDAWRAYRHKYAAWLQRIVLFKRPKSEAKKLKAVLGHKTHDVRIRCIGVWDTVDAYGVPFDKLAVFINALIVKYSFVDFELSPKVDYARHAMAIDDERKTFHPTLWNSDKCDPNRIRQVWFPGMHADVGGGYPKHGLSLLTLRWMVEEINAISSGVTISGKVSAKEREVLELQKAGLQWVDSDKLYFHTHSNSDDVMHNSRSGLATYYRYEPRNIAKLCHDTKKNIDIDEVIHDSALRRIRSRTQGYAPRGIPMKFKKEVTGSGVVGNVNLGTGQSQYELCGTTIGSRRIVQYLLYTITVVALGFVLVAEMRSSGSMMAAIVQLPKNLVTLGGTRSAVSSAYEQNPMLTIVLAGAVAFLVGSSFFIRPRIGRMCRDFWETRRKSI